jgi:hypothetical protein
MQLRAARRLVIEDEIQNDIEWALNAFDTLLPVEGAGEGGLQDGAEGGELDNVEGKEREEKEEEDGAVQVISVTDGVEVLDAEKAFQLLQQCSVVVGLHPDQAVGSLIDFALEHKKPFACIPCCVYWKTFPRRRLADGSQVRTYEQLMAWLKEKHPDIREVSIDFEGKNRLLWWRPEETP